LCRHDYVVQRFAFLRLSQLADLASSI
jgi:hypothetical protein